MSELTSTPAGTANERHIRRRRRTYLSGQRVRHRAGLVLVTSAALSLGSLANAMAASPPPGGNGKGTFRTSIPNENVPGLNDDVVKLNSESYGETEPVIITDTILNVVSPGDLIGDLSDETSFTWSLSEEKALGCVVGVCLKGSVQIGDHTTPFISAPQQYGYEDITPALPEGEYEIAMEVEECEDTIPEGGCEVTPHNEGEAEYESEAEVRRAGVGALPRPSSLSVLPRAPLPPLNPIKLARTVPVKIAVNH